MKSPQSRYLDVRGLRYHCTCWGRPGAPLLLMLHGWGDAGGSFAFVAERLKRDWYVVAPDWRGFGRSERAPGGYWFPDYFGDLECLLDQLAPGAMVPLVGHSLGGNIALMYAGIRPARITSVVAIDAFGLADRAPEEAPGRYEKWLQELAQPAALRDYDSFEALAQRLQKQNPRLDDAKAAYLARVLGVSDERDRVRLAADPAHRRVNPVLYRRAEAEACWRRVKAPVMWIEPEDLRLREQLGLTPEVVEANKACFADFRERFIPETGHNLHHDAPAEVARLIDEFAIAGGGEVADAA
ncbi:alpha/beta hydrolase [Nitrogeniibacter mangrovi]|uniref:Alpha/beta hydrolase n=1 Tax=Nitrogeniibacter mangrovi TaxID=2016596 RepID=A0A6C1B5L3_9RHOO|nr:alpha/beta hydrolase [Nitrogeniibacter mangrovi]QID17590.1 alpha/beta hydrolase [Nitrogeniibacter mangrovi]